MFPGFFDSIVFLVVYYGIIVAIFFRILLENKNPLKTQSYLLLLVLLPVFGLIIYFLFGVNYRKQKLFSRKAITDQVFISQWIDMYEERLSQNRDLAEEMFEEKYKLPYLFFRNASSVLTARNRVRILNNGEEKFPLLLEKLRQARHHIHMEYYIIIDDIIGKAVIDVLCQKAREGVEVRLIYDAIGSNGLSRRAIKRMDAAGVEVESYNPVFFTSLANKVNYRDHSKVVIIDGFTGFVGGINIADYYINEPTTDDFWRDTHCMVEGDAIYYLQMLFLLNWFFVRQQLVEPKPEYFPKVDLPSGVACAFVGSSPDSDSQYLMEAYFSMITNARHEILITTPYLIPNESILTALKTSAKSGVKVKVLLPEKSDTPFVHSASLTFIEDLIENDIEIYLYQKGVVHSKIIIVDEELCTIGSANMDYRSFDNNAEVNAFFFDEQLSKEAKYYFELDLQESRLVDLDKWRKRPWWLKVMGSIARLIAPLL
mgnify:CR=1 FL=1